MSERNKAISKRIFEEIYSRGNLDLIDELVSPNVVNHTAPPGLPPGTEGFKQQVSMIRNAMPDLQSNVDDLIAEGDKIVTRWTGTGTHLGEMMGIPPTGNTIVVSGVNVERIANGKVVEHWSVFDQLDFMQQLGAIPGPE